MQFSSLCQVLPLYSTQTSLTGEKATLGTMLPQNPSGLEPVTVGGEAASKPASSVKPACPASTSPLNWLADLTSGNVNKENKGECLLPSRTLVCSQRDLAPSVTEEQGGLRLVSFNSNFCLFSTLYIFPILSKWEHSVFSFIFLIRAIISGCLIIV